MTHCGAEPGYTPELSLVAELNGSVVGHIIFSDAYIDTDGGRIPAICLGPLAVHPDWQQRGIGSRLVEEGLAAGRRLGQPNRSSDWALHVLSALRI